MAGRVKRVELHQLGAALTSGEPQDSHGRRPHEDEGLQLWDLQRGEGFLASPSVLASTRLEISQVELPKEQVAPATSVLRAIPSCPN